MASNNNSVARFVNEIVHKEETDLNEDGVPQSHLNVFRCYASN